jgi:hypothetical protein
VRYGDFAQGCPAQLLICAFSIALALLKLAGIEFVLAAYCAK